MKTLTLQALDSKSLQIKGFGRNQKLEAISVDKIPGSIMVVSNKTSMTYRIYCIYDDMEDRWVFAIAHTSTTKNQNPYNFTIDQSWNNGKTHSEFHFPDDSIIFLEGEFSEDP